MTLAAETQSTVLPLLADPARYVACEWDLTRDDPAREKWLAVFSDHWPKLLHEAIEEGLDRGVDEASLRRQGEQATVPFTAFLDSVRNDPSQFERLTILQMCMAREKALRSAGIADPYRLAKQRENERALAVLPALLAQLDADLPVMRARRIIEGVFAGNIFDLGAVKTADMFTNGATVNFHSVRSKLKSRPWLFDDLDNWLDRLGNGPAYRSALMFVDNAGPDICLGMIPFARDLVLRGARVMLAANETPTLNDITASELVELLEKIAAFDEPIRAARADGRLSVISSGNGYPLIDLKQVCPAFVKTVASQKPDLLVIEGMGRAIETNFNAAFTCDTLKLAMIKDPAVAEKLGGELYDLVMRFERGPGN